MDRVHVFTSSPPGLWEGGKKANPHAVIAARGSCRSASVKTSAIPLSLIEYYISGVAIGGVFPCQRHLGQFASPVHLPGSHYLVFAVPT
jgi:hypothetical protein